MTDKKAYQTTQQSVLIMRVQALDPEIDSYIAALKKKYQKYSMPLDEVRKLVDASMDEKTLTQLLYEARE